MEPGPDVLVVLPAYNEQASVGVVVGEVRREAPGVRVLVVDDGSTDATASVARAAGAEVVSDVLNLGVGGAMRVGFRYAAAHGFRAVVQVDADGQHDPRDLPRLLAPLDPDAPPMVVIGARFAGTGEFPVPLARRLAMRLLAAYLSRLTRVRLTDVTSGFRAHNRAAIELFARTYPADYLADTVESLVIAAGAGGTVLQVPVTMRPRYAGTSTQSTGKAALYLARVVLMLALTILRRRPPLGRAALGRAPSPRPVPPAPGNPAGRPGNPAGRPDHPAGRPDHLAGPPGNEPPAGPPGNEPPAGPPGNRAVQPYEQAVQPGFEQGGAP